MSSFIGIFYIWTFVYFCPYINWSDAKREYAIKFEKVECTHQLPRVIAAFNCLIEIRNGRSFVSGNLFLLEPMNSLNLHVFITFRSSSGHNLKLLDQHLNGCELLEIAHTVPLMKYTKNLLLKYLNEFPRCPLRANFNYTVNKLTIDENEFPALVPNGHFRVVLDFFNHSTKPIIHYALTGAVKNIHTRNIQLKKITSN